MAIHPLDKRRWADVKRHLSRISSVRAALLLKGASLDEFGRLTPAPALNGRHRVALTLALAAKANNKSPFSLRLNRIQILDLRGQLIWYLPEIFHHFKRLRVLYLGDNGLKSLPSSLGLASKLQALYLGRNHIRSLPKSLLKLWPSLTTIHLGINRIRTVPFTEYNMPALSRGSIGENPIVEPVGTRWMLRSDAIEAAQRILECFSVATAHGGSQKDIWAIASQGIALAKHLDEPMIYEYLFKGMQIDESGRLLWNDNFPQMPGGVIRYAGLSLLPYIVRGSVIHPSLWRQNITVIDLSRESFAPPSELVAINGWRVIVRP